MTAGPDPAPDTSAASSPSPVRERAESVLRVLVGRDDVVLREDQWRAIEALVIGRRRALVVQRTGWGKSAVYFVATVLVREGWASWRPGRPTPAPGSRSGVGPGSGPTVIISPLLALMRDQVAAARRAGISAVTMNSANAAQWPAIEEQVRTGDVDVLLVSPERLNNPTFRDEILPRLAAGAGLVVVDEQHRFGVDQRDALAGGGVHTLVMTATPIPRTIAMSVFGDLDVSVVDELPPGRKPIQTLHKYDDQMPSLYNGIRQQIRLGRQVYIVYPLIKESERMDLKNLEDGFSALCDIFPEFRLSKVHGKMKDKEKEAEMQKFVSGQTQILVATTVIEVGVNVPNASVMVILDAQRFGLSQLHQLRGRVGRGADQSYCILVTSHRLTKETSRRIDIMCETNDGFEIAEADLKLRGPGDLEGTQQSGIAFDLKIADIARDGQIVQMAREEAQKIIDADPDCRKSEYNLLWDRLNALRKTNINWAAIS